MHPSNRSGFSLVELSIVLVILGLLVGGILGGQSLIRAAELRAITTELQDWQIAVNSFKTRYGALPGDWRDATRFQGNAGDSVCNQVRSDSHAAALANGTCNGNGNGVVGSYDGEIFEWFLFWHHLGWYPASIAACAAVPRWIPYPAPIYPVPVSAAAGEW